MHGNLPNQVHSRRLYQAERYDPNKCKSKKRTAAEIQGEDTLMKKQMYTAFMSKMNTFEDQDDPEDEHEVFCKSVAMQMKQVQHL